MRKGASASDPFILDIVDALDAFRLVDLLGVAAGAASGALAARRQDGFDLVGVLGLAFACGLGGGLLRDLLLAQGHARRADRRALSADRDHRHDHRLGDRRRARAACAAHDPDLRRARRRLLRRRQRAARPRGRRHRARAAADRRLGGSGGALLRDVLTAHTPEIFRHGELNALAALAAAGVFLAADTLLSTTVAMAIGLLVGFALRAAAIHFGLRGPAPRTSRRDDP